MVGGGGVRKGRALLSMVILWKENTVGQKQSSRFLQGIRNSFLTPVRDGQTMGDAQLNLLFTDHMVSLTIITMTRVVFKILRGIKMNS